MGSIKADTQLYVPLGDDDSDDLEIVAVWKHPQLNNSNLEILLSAPVSITPDIQSHLGGLTSHENPLPWHAFKKTLKNHWYKFALVELEKLIHAQCCTGLHSGLSQKASSLFKVRSLLANSKKKKKETGCLSDLGMICGLIEQGLVLFYSSPSEPVRNHWSSAASLPATNLSVFFYVKDFLR